MNTMKNIFSITCLMLSTALMPLANAGTATGKLAIKVTIGTGCKLTSGSKSLVDFGNVDNLDRAPRASSDPDNGIEVQCTKDIPYLIGLDAGIHQPQPALDRVRRMKSGLNYIKYDIYKDSKYNLRWGDAITGEDAGLAGIGTGEVQKYPVYAIIALDKSPVAGQYSDQVTITVSY